MASKALVRNSPLVAVQKTDTWNLALEKLRPEERDKIVTGREHRLDALAQLRDVLVDKMEFCVSTEWKVGGVKLRDVLGKILHWVDKFKGIGDIVVQFDPGHASIPWACFRLILMVALNDIQIRVSLLHGLEYISNLITRCTLIEHVFTNKELITQKEFVARLTDVYAGVLQYLGLVRSYFQKSPASRLAADGTELTSQIRLINAKELEVGHLMQITTAELITVSQRNLLKELGPIKEISGRVSRMDEQLKGNERIAVLDWLSDVPFREHHTNIREGRLPESGEWLMRKDIYKAWINDVSSSVLWLFGIAGSGKSKLISLVIDTNEEGGPFEPVSFFYCTDNSSEPARKNPEEILRCILRQFLGPDGIEALSKKYYSRREKGFGKLSVEESTQEIIACTNQYTKSTIIIDAFEECYPETSWKLLNALDKIVTESAKPVKIFISSRTHVNIPTRLKDSPQICIDEKDNSEDIKNFIKFQVEQAIKHRTILDGQISQNLRLELAETLMEGAQGMFQWVSLQLQHLCGPRMRSEADIQHELGQLPKKLKDTYSKIYRQISDLGTPSRLTAERALSWLLCSQRQISRDEFISAVSLDSGVSTTTEGHILSICSNLVVLDKSLNVFRFAHFSVREYLESHEDYSPMKIHAVAAERCLRGLQKPVGVSNSNDPLQAYANLYWAVHCQMSESFRHAESLQPLFTKFIGKSEQRDSGFITWSHSGKEYLKLIAWDDTFRPRFESMLSEPSEPLFASCTFGFQEVVDNLRRYSKEALQQKNVRGDTGLHLASRCGHQGIVEALLKIGADVDCKSTNGSAALHIAAEQGDDKIVRILLSSGACVNIRDKMNETALICACKSQSIGVAEVLLNAKLPINAEDKNGRTALHHAAERGYDSVLELLLEKGAATTGKDNEGSTALHEASEKGHYTVVSRLLDHGAVIDSEDSIGWTPLGRALWKGRESVARLLLSKGAKLPTEVESWRPLHWSVERRNDGITTLLLENGADVTARDKLGRTPLHRAAWAGHEAVALQLMFQGADVSVKDNSGCDALSYASGEGHSNIVELFLDNRVAAGSKDHKGRTPLHHAAARGHEKVVQLLINGEAAIHEKDNDEKPPLHHAATIGRTEVVRLLLSSGAKDTGDHHGKSALHYAAERGHINVVVQLLEGIMLSGDGDINMQDFYGMTACHWAAKEGHLEIVKLLIRNGAHPTLTDYEDMTVWDWEAREGGNLEALREPL